MRRPSLTLLSALLATGSATAQCEIAELVSSDPVFAGRFGSSVDLAGDRAIVGQPSATTGESAYVFERVGSTWLVDARLTSPGQELSVDFGSSVAIDGDLVAVAAGFDDEAGPDYGAVHVFERFGSDWSPVAKLLPSSSLPPAFGWRLAIDGGSIFVSAPAEPPAAPNAGSGAVYVFEQLGGQWVQFQKITGPDLSPMTSESFGGTIAVDGARIAIGVPNVGPATNKWQVRLYQRAGPLAPFLFSEKVDSPPGLGYGNGIAVDLCGDDLVVGANESSSGGVALFHRRVAGTWTLVDTFASTDFYPGAGNLSFGREGVAVENGTAIVAGPDSPVVGSPIPGSAHLLEFHGANWVHRGQIHSTDGANDDEFAGHLDLDQGVAIFGAAKHSHGAPGLAEEGAAYLVDLTVRPAIYCTGKLNSLGCEAALDWHGIASATNPLPFRVDATAILSNKPGLFFYGTTGRANLPFLGGILCALPPLSRTPPQASGGSGPPDTCTGAFAFDLNDRIQSGVDPDLVPGVTVAGQYWSRDPDQPDGTGVHLTEAIEATICP